MRKDTFCLITNDVETTSILNHKLSVKTGEYVLKEGMPRLLKLYLKYDIKTTFFFTGHIAKLYPDVVRMILPFGHEVASHGFSHEIQDSFDLLSLEKQKEQLTRSKDILEDICGKEVVSFRAPALRVNKDMARALIDTGFLIDSSIASQRFDMFLSFGIKNKMNWLFAPRKPYFINPNNIFSKGESSLLEIPISSFFIPYIGTVMRLLPLTTKILRYFLHFESKMTNKPIVFLTHPNEFINEIKRYNNIEKRGDNLISSFFSDTIRHQIKLKNLGKSALPIYEKELFFFKNEGYSFLRLKDYYNLNKTIKDVGKGK